MRRWGLVVTGFYAVLVASLFWPAVLRLGGRSWPEAYEEAFVSRAASDWVLWMVLGLLVAGQALLLSLSVDTSWQRLRPRRGVRVSAAVVGFFVALLALAVISSIWAVAAGDDVIEGLAPGSGSLSLSLWLLGLWSFWGIVFYAYYRGVPARVTSAVSWLLTVSVLELLVAVPSHVIVRRRDECSAPTVTGFGIATGIAVMLACFGPGVLALYKGRIERYRARSGSDPVSCRSVHKR